MIVGVVLVSLVTAILIEIYPPKYVTEAIISLNFPGIEKHKNPDGTLFEPRQIIAPKLLSNVSSSLDLGEKKNSILRENLVDMVFIEPIIPPEIKEEMEKAEKEKKTFEFFPNQFRLTLTTRYKKIFSPKERTQILYSIIDEYRKEFNRRFGEEPLVAISFPPNFLTAYDYVDIVDGFKVRINNLSDFLDSKINKAGFFRSKKSGLSFKDIRDEVELLKNFEVKIAESTIRTLKITKDTETLINRYKYKIKQLELKRQKKEAEALIARKLLKEVEESSGILKGQYSTSKTESPRVVLDSSFIDRIIKDNYRKTLVETALKASTKAKELEIEKAFWEKEIAELKEKEQKQEKEQEQEKGLREILKTIQNKLLFLSQKANELNKEYLEEIVVNNAVQVVKNPETSMLIKGNLKRDLLLAGVMGLMFSIFIAFFLEYIEKVRVVKEKNRKAL